MWIIPLLLGWVVLDLFMCAFIAYRMTFYTNRKKHYKLGSLQDPTDDEIKIRAHELVVDFMKREYEEVFIESEDGLRLAANYYHTRDGAPIQICFNGYRSRVERDFSGGGKEAILAGCNLLLVHQRAHGKSEGRTISFGVKERGDVLLWVEYAKRRFGEGVKIILAGVSMGAMTVLSASDLDFGGNVVGILADCPCSTAKRIIKKVISEMGVSPTLFYPLVRLGGLLFGGFDPNKADAPSHVKNTKIPILLIHGEGDKFVPISMSEEIAEASELVSFHSFKDATHGKSYIYDTEKYRALLTEFYDKIL